MSYQLLYNLLLLLLLLLQTALLTFACGPLNDISVSPPCRWKNHPMINCNDHGDLNATTDVQYLQSPNYPIAYPKNMVCRWLINIVNCPGNTEVEYVIQVRVEHFEIQDSPSCTKDYLIVRDGQRMWSNPLARFCGSKCSKAKQNNTMTGSEPFMMVYFQTDVDLQKQPDYAGFRLSFQCVPKENRVSVTASYSAVNFVLMGVSGLLLSSLVLILLALCLRETVRSRRNKNIHIYS